MSSGWCTIESDPGVFSDVLASMGAEGCEVSELYGTDVADMRALDPVYGLIFLFKWTPEKDPRPCITEGVEGLFFANQVINNACATQALLACVLNSPIRLNPSLQEFKDFTLSLPADLAGEAIGNSETLRAAHNSFARPEPFHFVEDSKDKEGADTEDAFHFISYVPHGNKVYELDGLKKGPILLEDLSETGRDWLMAAAENINKRIESFENKEIRFNLMAIVKKRRDVIEEKMRAMEPLLSSPEVSPSIVSEYEELKHSLSEEIKKEEKWNKENIRRRHNYVPFIFNLLKILAEKGKLNELTQQAARVQAERVAANRKNNEKSKESPMITE